MGQGRAGARDDLSTGTRPSLRRVNLGRALRTVAGGWPLSRADVAARTGTTRATASRLVDELVEARLLDELERPVPTKRGRPGTPLAPGATICALGLQVDVDLLAVRVLDLRGGVQVERLVHRSLAAADPGPVLDLLRDLVGEVVQECHRQDLRLTGAGAALPGLVARDGGRLLLAPNLGWADLDVVERLADALPAGLPLRVGNEADMAARALLETGPGRPDVQQDFLYVSGGPGVGGCVVVSGRPVSGTRGWGGEVGHVCVSPDGPACRCGSTGCLEQYAGLPALLRALGLSQRAGEADMLEALASASPAAADARADLVEALAIALGSALNVLDLPVVVLGGHLARLEDDTVARLEEALARRVVSAPWGRTEVRRAPDTVAAGATGAALSVLADVLQDPVAYLPAAG